VLCDGTGNSPTTDYTNIQALHKVLLDNKRQDIQLILANHKEGWSINKNQAGDLIYYDRGLGTLSIESKQVGDEKQLILSWHSVRHDIYDHFAKYSGYFGMINTWQQTFAAGILDNVAEAYKFLAENYSKGDQVYLFGFSRGAYTLRLLIAVISYIGLVDIAKIPYGKKLESIIAQGFKLYCIDKNSDDKVLANLFYNKYCHPKAQLINFLGLWDTVRGYVLESIPADAKLSSIVKTARHAISIDEQRKIFKPELWVASEKTNSQQVWFSGVHADVGGGYIDNNQLAQISLAWMIDEANIFGLEIQPIDRSTLNPLAMQHDSLHGRIQENSPLTWSMATKLYRRPVAQISMHERLHESVFTRYGQQISIAGVIKAYNPANVTHTLIAFHNCILAYNLIALIPRPVNADELSDVEEDTSLVYKSRNLHNDYQYTEAIVIYNTQEFRALKLQTPEIKLGDSVQPLLVGAGIYNAGAAIDSNIINIAARNSAARRNGTFGL
jgi:hypothetical protein